MKGAARGGTCSILIKDKDHPVPLYCSPADDLRKTEFVRWRVKGSELPLRWGDALHR